MHLSKTEAKQNDVCIQVDVNIAFLKKNAILFHAVQMIFLNFTSSVTNSKKHVHYYCVFGANYYWEYIYIGESNEHNTTHFYEAIPAKNRSFFSSSYRIEKRKKNR